MTPEADNRAPEPSAVTGAPVNGSGSPSANPYARTRVSGAFTVIEATGEIDVATAGFLGEHLDAATAGAAPDVLVDLRYVDFFDCSGLRVLCRAGTRAVERGGRVRVVSVQPRIRKLLGAAGLLGRFPPLPAIPGERD
ncbi:STAS domain-containing protein [Streptomyces sp. HUAS ZL42]|uniref:STAS domain-containing protein n=1 Tax=Streptomyces sp. HUAS ZL42 TaxID=3231715 RepID=UPI00345E147F